MEGAQSNSHTELVPPAEATEDSSSSDSEEEGESVMPSLPPSHFSNFVVQAKEGHVHVGPKTVYQVVVKPGDQEGPPCIAGPQHEFSEHDVGAHLQNLQRVIAATHPNPQPEKILYADQASSRLPYKTIFAASFVLLLVIGLGAALIVIWRLKISEDPSEEIVYPDYDKASNFINGTLGSAPYYSRLDWLAQPVQAGNPLKHPVPFIIVSHSATGPCLNNSQCILQVRKFQVYHIESYGWADIGYNFLVGGDGGIYEGRGWDTIGAHARGYNNISIGINMIGTFNDVLPTGAQMLSVRILFEEGVRLGKVAADYKLIGHRQVSETESPGIRFFRVLQTWPHWFDFVDHSKPSPISAKLPKI